VYNIYFAGDLFDQKHLTGNFLLAKAIAEVSNNRYCCLLPQDWEMAITSAVGIRNNDIKRLMAADLVLFNFDGVDLDSGTVVEFMIAKMLDIPSVLLRTDFRNGGYLFGEDWNAMVAGFPRCVVVKHHSLMMYHKLGIDQMHKTLAETIIQSFKKVMAEKTLFSSYDEIVIAYQLVVKICGGNLEELVPHFMVKDLINAKIEKNIYPATSMKQDKTSRQETVY
jgi:nucleoside 2-deoxyribosyltransferase